jgi:hypothetical protein
MFERQRAQQSGQRLGDRAFVAGALGVRGQLDERVAGPDRGRKLFDQVAERLQLGVDGRLEGRLFIHPEVSARCVATPTGLRPVDSCKPRAAVAGGALASMRLQLGRDP